MRMGTTELLLVLVIVLLLWGPSKLPEVGRSLGRSISEFRRGLRGEPAKEEPPAPSAPQPPRVEP